jgi:hypothetical protein
VWNASVNVVELRERHCAVPMGRYSGASVVNDAKLAVVVVVVVVRHGSVSGSAPLESRMELPFLLGMSASPLNLTKY